MEQDLVPRAGYPFFRVRIRGFQRKVGFSTLLTLASLPLAGVDAWRLLRSYKPDCVVGVGAYVSGPVVAEAALAGIPAVAVEMDADLGWTNRILSQMVDKVCLSFPQPGLSRGSSSTRAGLCRPALLTATREEGLTRFELDPARPVLLVFGGSQGAHTLNEAALKAFAGVQTPFQILHVTGKREYSARSSGVDEAWRQTPTTRPSRSCDDFPVALAVADAVVARAGGSVAEILARGVPALLVPYPYATGDHQTQERRAWWRLPARRSLCRTPNSTDAGWPQPSTDHPRTRDQQAHAGSCLAPGPAGRGRPHRRRSSRIGRRASGEGP